MLNVTELNVRNTEHIRRIGLANKSGWMLSSDHGGRRTTNLGAIFGTLLTLLRGNSSSQNEVGTSAGSTDPASGTYVQSIA